MLTKNRYRLLGADTFTARATRVDYARAIGVLLFVTSLFVAIWVRHDPPRNPGLLMETLAIVGALGLLTFVIAMLKGIMLDSRKPFDQWELLELGRIAAEAPAIKDYLISAKTKYGELDRRHLQEARSMSAQLYYRQAGARTAGAAIVEKARLDSLLCTKD